MHWIKKLKLSFPVKLSVVIIVLITVPLVVLATQYMAQGYVVVNVAKPNGWVVVDGETYDAPYKSRLKSGKKTIYFGAVGYNEQRAIIAVYPFRVKRVFNLSPTTPLLYEYSEETGYLEEFEAKNAWAKKLPYFQVGQFEIGYPFPDGTIEVTFLLRPGNYTAGEDDKQYQSDVKNVKQKALEWFKNEGADVSKLTINWVPHDPGN